MNALGFVVVAAMLTVYVLLDGYDLGVAAITPWVARSDRERAAAMAAIGPFWNGNEVWLIAAGGALFALFPLAYASAFSGFYLPFMVVLWLLMFRGIAMEVRGHFPSELWHQFWDAAFALASGLLVAIFGVALGNLVRGLPLDAHGYFQGTFTYLLNPYALLVGIFAVAALAQHGAIFLAMRVEGELATRSRRLLRVLWWAVLVLYAVVTAATFAARGGLPSPAWLYAAAAGSVAALAAIMYFAHRSMTATFAASSAFVALLLVQAAGTLFPYLIPAYPASSGGLSIYDGTPSPLALACALTVTIPGGIAVLAYAVAVWRRLGAKIPAD